MTARSIDTEAFSATLRARAIDVANRRLLITNFRGSDQVHDLTEPANCEGFGRIRHFRREAGAGWPENPLPIDPACRALGTAPRDEIRAQVFQNAACNWRCWYCFVDFSLLAADPKRSRMLSAADLIDLYLAEPSRPDLIDLTGGQPDLVPEWIPWMMRDLRARGLDHTVYLWSDDNLSNDYFWQFLDDEDRELIASYPLYGKVGCFKGFDAASFAHNTRAAPELFDRQFQLMGRALALGIDHYAYATFTTHESSGIEVGMARFVERLQQLDEHLPLRTIPLEIRVFSPMQARDIPDINAMLTNQLRAAEAWRYEMQRRFSSADRALPITEVPLAHRRMQS